VLGAGLYTVMGAIWVTDLPRLFAIRGGRWSGNCHAWSHRFHKHLVGIDPTFHPLHQLFLAHNLQQLPREWTINGVLNVEHDCIVGVSAVVNVRAGLIYFYKARPESLMQ